MNFEDELKKRMALARQQGWNDDEIQRSALIERGIYRQRQAADQARRQPKPSGAGRAGGLKGFALDMLPFGRVVEKKVNPNAGKITLQELGTEALLTALPFGLGRLAKGARAAKAAKSAVTATKAAPRIAPPAAKLPTRARDLFVNQSGQTGRVSSELLRQSTIPAKSTLKTAAEQKRLVDLTRTMPSMRGSATRKFRNTDDAIGKMADEVDQLFAGVKTRMPAKRFQGGINTVKREIVDPLERKRFNIEYDRVVRRAFGGKLPSQLSPTEVNTLRRAVNGQMSGIYTKIEKGTQLTDKDNAFLRLKDTLDEQIAALAPKNVRGRVKELNVNMNTLMKGRPELQKASEQTFAPMGMNIPGVSSAIPRVVQATADVAGRAGVQAGRVTKAPVGRAVKGQAYTRIAADLLGMRPNRTPATVGDELPASPALAFPDTQVPEEQMLNDLLAGGVTDFGQLASAVYTPQQNGPQADFGGAGMDGTGGLQYSSTELFNAALEAQMAGDPKTAKVLQSFAMDAMAMEKEAAKAGGKGGNGLNVTKVTAQQYGLAQSGSEALQNLSQLLQTDPSVVSRSATPGRSLPIAGGFISNAAGTGDFDAIGYNIADTILRLRTGATANESEVRKLQSQIMPRAGDSPQTIQTKMKQIDSIFRNVLDLASQSSAGGSFEDEMMQMLMSGQSQYAY